MQDLLTSTIGREKARRQPAAKRQPAENGRRRSVVVALRVSWAITAFVAGWGIGDSASRAAEIHLRAEAQVESPIVTLGSVAMVIADDRAEVERLNEIELFPQPPAGRPRVVHVQEVRDLLLLRGVDLLGHRFSGASQVTISGAGRAETRSAEPVSASVAGRVQRELSEAIAAYLNRRCDQPRTWNVELDLDQPQLQALVADGQSYSVDGGTAPWVGRQRFRLVLDSTELSVFADVSLPPSIVVAVRAIPRGALIRPGDVQLQAGGPQFNGGEALTSLEEAIGRETTQGIPAGKILDHDCVRAPLLVQRGEVVTVYVRSPGIKIRTTGRVRGDGSLGELVAVESLLNRKRYFARVCGVQEVEVYGRAIQAATEPSPDSASQAAPNDLKAPEPYRFSTLSTQETR